MTTFIARSSLAVISIGCMLGNYWFTFGLWPRNWGAFTFFAVAQLLLALANVAMSKETK